MLISVILGTVKILVSRRMLHFVQHVDDKYDARSPRRRFSVFVHRRDPRAGTFCVFIR